MTSDNLKHAMQSRIEKVILLLNFVPDNNINRRELFTPYLLYTTKQVWYPNDSNHCGSSGTQVKIERREGRGGEMLETEKKFWYFRPYFWGDKEGGGGH